METNYIVNCNFSTGNEVREVTCDALGRVTWTAIGPSVILDVYRDCVRGSLGRSCQPLAQPHE